MIQIIRRVRKGELTHERPGKSNLRSKKLRLNTEKPAFKRCF